MTATFPKNMRVQRPESSRPFRKVGAGPGSLSHSGVSLFCSPSPPPLPQPPLVPAPLPGGTQPELGWRNDRKCRKVQIRSEAPGPKCSRPAARLEMGTRFRKMWREKPIQAGKAELQRREDRRMAWEEASQSGTKSHRQTPSQGASEAGGPEVLQRFAPASPAVAPSLTRPPSARETSRSPPNLDLALQPKAWDPRPHHELDPRWWGVERWLHSPQ